jgi:hypothetical protein
VKPASLKHLPPKSVVDNLTMLAQHGDPAAEKFAAMLALGAEFDIESHAGCRTLKRTSTAGCRLKMLLRL